MTANDPPRSHNAVWTVDGLKYLPLPGGLCVHRPNFNRDHNQHHDFFLAFCRNLLLQSPQSSAVAERSREMLWTREEKSIRNNISVKDATNNISGKKRGRKRKVDLLGHTSSFHHKSHTVDEALSMKMEDMKTESYVDELIDINSIASKTESRTPTPSPETDDVEELESQDFKIWHSTHLKPMPQELSIAPDATIHRSTEKIKPESLIIGLENDEVMLEYLQLRHNGDVERGKYLTLASLSMGKCKYLVFNHHVLRILTCYETQY
jgi:hypothetical protein